MNAKMPNRKTKAPTSRGSGKPAPVAVAARKPTVSPASAKICKSVPGGRAKGTPRSASVAPPASANLAGKSKQARLISLLQAAPGATIDQMMTLTGWQAHTVRGTISGVLRKKLGLNVACVPSTDSGTRLYRIVGATVRA